MFSPRTDLAIEHQTITDKKIGEGFRHRHAENGDMTVDTVEILDKNGEKALQRPKGVYITLTFDRPSHPDLSKSIAKEIGRLLSPDCRRILTVGIGNRDITADAIGPLVAKGIRVTGHLENVDGKRHFAFSPDVLGKTGIESLALIERAREASSADAVIVVDALAAQSLKRLYKTVQIGSGGIVPGSGVGNHRAAITKESLGVPVIAVGVPTVVSSATLVHDTLKGTSLSSLYEKLDPILRDMEPFFVTPPDADTDTEILAAAIAEAINSL